MNAPQHQFAFYDGSSYNSPTFLTRIAFYLSSIPLSSFVPAHQVGFKPAGGIRAAKDTLTWLALMKDELGDEWTKPDLFRLGASALVVDIERQLFHHITGHYAAGYQMPLS